jgi:hypothetical protein
MRRLVAMCVATLAGGLLLGAAGQPAHAGASAGARVTARASYPPLVLKGTLTRSVAWARLPVSVTWDGAKAGNINPGLRAKYQGQTISKLVGLVDDKKPGSFNIAKAREGYKIMFVCSDGYKRTIKSQSIVGQRTYIIARLKMGKPLPEGEGPYRYVGGFIKPFYGKDSARMIVEVRLLF